MSENGPREGTRDLPRPAPETRGRAVTDDSPAGVAYHALSKSLRRRRAELASLVESGMSAADAAKSYQADHPLEPIVTRDEIDVAVAGAKTVAERRSPKTSEARRPSHPTTKRSS
jgi:hypothetical protein